MTNTRKEIRKKNFIKILFVPKNNSMLSMVKAIQTSTAEFVVIFKKKFTCQG
jgi:hypothetical protein